MLLALVLVLIKDRDFWFPSAPATLSESEPVEQIGDERKSEFLGNAVALLFPINWPEPFGLVMIEAMACGTPVIAWNYGAVPEVIDEGVTGFMAIATMLPRLVNAAKARAELGFDPGFRCP